MQVYTTDKTSARSFPWLWAFRLIALLVTFIVLVTTALNTKNFHDIQCNTPPQLSYNVAVSVLSLIVLIYFILASGPTRGTRLLPWFIWGQLGLDAIFFIFWLSAAATSNYSCTDLCHACKIPRGYVIIDGNSCSCYTYYTKRDYFSTPDYQIRSRAVLPPESGVNSKGFKTGGKIAAKHACDALMTVFFAFFVAADIFWVVQSRKTSASTAPVTTNGPPIGSEEAGLPMGPSAQNVNQQREQVPMQSYPSPRV